MPSLINKDQTGFIQIQLSSDNICRVLNINNCAKDINTPVVALSLDAANTFDQLEWPFLFAVQKREEKDFWSKFNTISIHTLSQSIGNDSNKF